MPTTLSVAVAATTAKTEYEPGKYSAIASTGRRTSTERPPALLCTVGLVPPETSNRPTETR